MSESEAQRVSIDPIPPPVRPALVVPGVRRGSSTLRSGRIVADVAGALGPCQPKVEYEPAP